MVADLDRAVPTEGADPGGPPAAVGVGAPGMVDRSGRLCFAPNLPQAQGVDWNELIGDELPGRTILIENDANFAVLAEHRLGAARGFGHVVMVTLGTGIGGGIVIDGRVQVGAAGFAGEIGHMVVDPAGPECPCGRRGCWERFASGAGLGVLAREAALAGRLTRRGPRSPAAIPRAVRGEDISAAAAAGDPAAQEVIHAVGRWIGFGLANLAAVLDPECFVLGGGVVLAGDLLIASARTAFAELVEGGDRRPSGGDRARRLRRARRRGGRRAGRARGRVGLMRTGVVLPTFRDRPDEAIRRRHRRRRRRCGRPVLLRPHLADRTARAPGSGALSDSRCPGHHARPVRGTGGGALPRARWWPGSAWFPTRCSPRSSSRSSGWRPAG